MEPETPVTAAAEEMETETDTVSPPPAKKRRYGTRPKKNEVLLKSKLEKHLILGNDPPNAWAAYKNATREIREVKKLEKQAQEDNQTDAQKVSKLLALASRHKKFGDTLIGQGKTPQAEGLHKRSQEKLEEAQDLFKSLNRSEKASVTGPEKKCLKSGDFMCLAKGPFSVKTLEGKVSNLQKSLVKVSGWVKDEHQGEAEQVLKQVGIA